MSRFQETIATGFAGGCNIPKGREPQAHRASPRDSIYIIGASLHNIGASLHATYRTYGPLTPQGGGECPPGEAGGDSCMARELRSRVILYKPRRSRGML